MIPGTNSFPPRRTQPNPAEPGRTLLAGQVIPRHTVILDSAVPRPLDTRFFIYGWVAGITLSARTLCVQVLTNPHSPQSQSTRAPLVLALATVRTYR